MASNSYSRNDVNRQVTQYTRKGTQGRPKRFGKKFGQRLFIGDLEKIVRMGFEVNDFVRTAAHKLLNDLENCGDTELVKS